MAQPEDIQKAVAVGRSDPDGWRTLPMEQRWAILRRAADGLNAARADLIGAAAANTGKLFPEADVEVSEAVDLTRYYPLSMVEFGRHTNVPFKAKAWAWSISPWNFPIAIPCGGIIGGFGRREYGDFQTLLRGITGSMGIVQSAVGLPASHKTPCNFCPAAAVKAAAISSAIRMWILSFSPAARQQPWISAPSGPDCFWRPRPAGKTPLSSQPWPIGIRPLKT